MNIFLDVADFLFFIRRLKEALYPEQMVTIGRQPPNGYHQGSAYVPKQLPIQAFTLISYCLMPNHFHFLIR